MRTLHDPLRMTIAKKIIAIQSSCSLEEIYDFLVEPPNTGMGDLAYGCFVLAKKLKKSPAILAQELSKDLQADPFFLKVEAAGPYLNFTFQSQVIGESLINPIIDKSFFNTKLSQQTPKTMIEFSQPNTHKELHVGHMRNLCLGDSLVRLLRYSGYEIISSTFPGDVGTHVAKCLWYLTYRNQEAIPSEGKGEWLGKMYSAAHNKLEDEVGTASELENKNHLTEILHQLEKKQGRYYDLWRETREWSIDLMNRVYKWADVSFDKWYWESDVDSASVAYAKQLLAEGKLIESQGAIGMDLEADKLGFCMLIKSDGSGLYATKDIELARRKFQDQHIQKSVYVVDMRQALHFKQVFKVLEKLGFSEAKDCFHLQYNFVELPDGAMSSRKGNIVPITELIEKMETVVREQYLKRYVGEWTSDEIDLVAAQVAKGAIRYGMLKIDNNKKIVFDMNEWLKIDGDSGPFIQYSYARINSLCKKLNHGAGPFDYSLLNHNCERKIMQSLMQFHTVVIKAAEDYKPSSLCNYLFDLAQRFNHFYHECPIGQADSESLKKARLALSEATGHVLKKGLELLGIPAPERM